jgi:hypothetical protein
MKLGVMQPYFFPYIGYFSLIKATDKWVVFDSVQYIRHGWVNRNRILHPTEGWQYIIAPLKKHQRSTRINDVEVVDGNQWRERIFGQLEHYRKGARFFRETSDLARHCLAGDEQNLARLNVQILARICEHLDLAFDHDVFSESKVPVPEVDDPGLWALRISQQYDADSYVNLPGGRELFDRSEFEKAGICLQFLEPASATYDQGRETFVPSLSILDVLMNCGREGTIELLKNYELVE